MAFDREAWLAENQDANGDLAPPWSRFPEISAFSIGWRMGAGEGWKWAWWDWVGTLPADRERRLAYLRRHPPAPRPWASSAYAVVDPTYREDGESTEAEDARWEEVEDTLEREGLVGDDVAFGAWVARYPTPAPPWRRDRTLASAIRYGSRRADVLRPVGRRAAHRWAARGMVEGGRRSTAIVARIRRCTLARRAAQVAAPESSGTRRGPRCSHHCRATAPVVGR